MARILVFSEHTLLRQGLARLLEDAAPESSASQAANVDQAVTALRAAADHTPEVVLLHLPTPDVPRLQSLHALREAAPEVPVVLLVEQIPDEVIVAALQAGASGCLDIDVDSASLVQALREAAQGEMALSQSFARRVARMIGAGRNGHERVPVDALTAREAEVLGLLADGLTNREIAATLFVSESTVRAHLRTVTQKLGVNNRVHAVARALQLGMVVSPSQAAGHHRLAGHTAGLAMLLLSIAGLAQGIPL